MDRNKLLRFFEQRHIDTRHVPLDVLIRARKVVERLERGESYLTFHGKRIRRDRKRISIPLGLRWRMLADDVDGRPRVRRIMSHQKYSALLAFK
jgi:hypothetical protein